jgi:hypothetical protein
MALKYYFAGRMFFARLKYFEIWAAENHIGISSYSETFEKWKEYKQDFQELYDGLLPMTNAQVSSPFVF